MRFLSPGCVIIAQAINNQKNVQINCGPNNMCQFSIVFVFFITIYFIWEKYRFLYFRLHGAI